MKSRTAFEFTVRKMMRHNAQMYFWTFTFEEVHAVKEAMERWNAFLTLLKRKVGFRGVRVVELHEEHGCHFHVLTNRRFPIRRILAFSKRYGFGRMDVRKTENPDRAIGYLCKYLSKKRPPCLRGARLWSAIGDIERTRVKDVLVDSPWSRLIRAAMGKRSVTSILAGEENDLRSVGRFRFEKNFQRAQEIAMRAYMAEFDPEFAQRQAIWEKVKSAGLVTPSEPWQSSRPELEEE